MEILQNIPLAPFTTLRIGGPARFFAEARSAEQAREAVLWAREQRQPLFVLGGGSNLVVADQGWPGLVLRNAIGGIAAQPRSGGDAVYEAGAGVGWDELVARAVADGCAGVECLSGIPGTVGATPVQNVGAYGQDVSQTIRTVDVLDLASLEWRQLGNAECGFAYRASKFNTADRGRYLIVRVGFALRPGGTPCMKYPDLQAHFAGRKNPPSLTEVRQAVLEIRRRKAMLVEESDPESHSAGSFFKNPLVSRADYERMAERWERQGISVPGFEQADGQVKLSAAWLVEHSGICKGFQLGPVGISRKHALALVNRGGATAADLLRLKELVESKVRETFAIQLQPEPVFVGFPEQ